MRFLYCLKIKSMNEKEKSLMIAEAENVEEIRDFFTQWWSVDELHETAAKASLTILNLIKRHKITDDEVQELEELMQQHMMMIDTIKPFARKEGDV